jgi:hypothetical protein
MKPMSTLTSLSQILHPSVIINQIDLTYDENNVLQITTQLRFRLSTAGDMEWSSVTIDFANHSGRLIFK